MKKKATILILMLLTSFLSSMLFLKVSNVQGRIYFAPAPPSPPATGNEYWDFNTSEIVAYRATQIMNGIAGPTVDIILNITNQGYYMLDGSNYYYFVECQQLMFNVTFNKLMPIWGAQSKNMSVINFTNGYMKNDWTGSQMPNIFIPNNGTDLAMYFCAAALLNTVYGMFFTGPPTMQITSNRIYMTDTTSSSYVDLWYAANGTLITGEILMDMGGGNTMVVNYTRIWDLNPIDEVSWPVEIDDILYYGMGTNETKYIITEFRNETMMMGGIGQTVYANYTIWNYTTETWEYNKANISMGQASESFVSPMYMIPNGTTGNDIKTYFEGMVVAGMISRLEYGEIWMRGYNDTSGDFFIYSFYPNGILRYIYFSSMQMIIYSQPDESMFMFYKNMTVLTAGAYNISWDVFDIEEEYNITAEVSVSDDTQFFFAGLPYNPSNESLNNALLYFDIMMNETANMDAPINLTIKYDPTLNGTFKLWYFNQSTGIWAWLELSITDDKAGTLKATLTHTSIYAITYIPYVPNEPNEPAGAPPDQPSAIPFSNFYLIFMIIGIVGVFFYYKKRIQSN